MKKYGLPYQGSKSKIAEKLGAMLPNADVFIDLFAGGCAMTDWALQSGKYKQVIANEIDYNVYILCAGLAANVRWGYLTWSSFDTWKTNTGHDTHSIYLDLTSKGGFSYLFNEDYTMKDVPEKAQILAVGAGLTKTFRGFPVKPTYEEAHQMQIDGTLDYYTRDLFY